MSSEYTASQSSARRRRESPHPTQEAEALSYRNRISENAERHRLYTHLQHGLQEAQGVLVRVPAEGPARFPGWQHSWRICTETARSGSAQELPCARALVLLLRDGTRRVGQHIRIDYAHTGRSAVGVCEAVRTCFGMDRCTVVERLAVRVVGHMQPDAAHVEVGDDGSKSLRLRSSADSRRRFSGHPTGPLP